MKYLISAIQFLTIIPLTSKHRVNPSKSIAFFPIVGLLLGFLLLIFDKMAMSFWSPAVVSLLDVVFLSAITGAFHLDGLGDAADGLYSKRTKEQALAIMKDSNVGMMGLIVVVCILSIKWCGIYSLTENRALLLLLIPAYARGSSLFGIKFLKYGRSSAGTGKTLFDKPLTWSSFSGLYITVFLSLFLLTKALYLNIFFVFITFFIIIYYKKKINCITGDMLGAMTEITEALLFLLISVRGL